MKPQFPTGAAKLAGVVGFPIHHSLSPFLHNAWIDDLGLNALYAPFSPHDSHGFDRLILSCRTNGIKGLNVTAPFKEQALSLCDAYSDTARESGSVNLMTFDEEGQIYGDSTDGLGLIKAFEIQAPHCDLSSGPVAILGAGGATRAVIAALLAKGCQDIRIINRTLLRAQELVFAFKAGISAYELNQAERAFEGCVCVINASSAGPIVPIDSLSPSACLMDMSYRPLKTAWLKSGEARGLTCVDGLAMLIEQARPSFEAFFGVPPNPQFDIRALVLEYLSSQTDEVKS